MTEKDQLLHDLKALGVKEGDAVLVHSSMKALGTKLTPEEVIDALQESVGEKGTLLMPALTYENVSGEQGVRQRLHPALHRTFAHSVLETARS